MYVYMYSLWFCSVREEIEFLLSASSSWTLGPSVLELRATKVCRVFFERLLLFSSNGVRVFWKGVQARRMIILKARRCRSLCFKRVYGDVVLRVHGTKKIFLTRFVRIAYERLDRRFIKLNSREKWGYEYWFIRMVQDLPLSAPCSCDKWTCASDFSLENGTLIVYLYNETEKFRKSASAWLLRDSCGLWLLKGD